MDTIPDSLIGEVLELGAPRTVLPPTVSVVLCTYRREHMLPKALRALLLVQPPVGGLELLVVDDGSPDNTRAVALDEVAAAPFPVRYIRLVKNAGLSTARNVGIKYAEGTFVAHTDDDCRVAPEWICQGVAGFAEPGVGAVQGATLPNPDQPVPLFNHYIHCEEADGSFSGCNVFYRREAQLAVGGFDPGCDYWEDMDFGWRVVRSGWQAKFAPDAVVYHDVVPISARKWLTWPTHFHSMPAKAARYPEFRRFLFGRVWVSRLHAAFDLALLGVGLGAVVHPVLLGLTAPYVVLFAQQRSLRGRWPVAKAFLHLAWDFVSFGVLVTHSVRHRSVVL